MALGIFIFAVMGMVGLLPVGLKSFKESKAKSVEALIVQQRANEVLQTPFVTLLGSPASVTGVQLYTEDGVEIGASSSRGSGAIPTSADSFPGKAVFASRVEIAPNLAVSNATSTNVLRAIIEVTRISSGANIAKYPVHVANLGK